MHPIGGGKPQPYVMYEYACREGDRGIENSLHGTQVALAQEAKKAAVPKASLTGSLIGSTEAAVRASSREGRKRRIPLA